MLEMWADAAEVVQIAKITGLSLIHAFSTIGGRNAPETGAPLYKRPS